MREIRTFLSKMMSRLSRVTVVLVAIFVLAAIAVWFLPYFNSACGESGCFEQNEASATLMPIVMVLSAVMGVVSVIRDIRQHGTQPDSSKEPENVETLQALEEADSGEIMWPAMPSTDDERRRIADGHEAPPEGEYLLGEALKTAQVNFCADALMAWGHPQLAASVRSVDAARRKKQHPF